MFYKYNVFVNFLFCIVLFCKHNVFVNFCFVLFCKHNLSVNVLFCKHNVFVNFCFVNITCLYIFYFVFLFVL